MNYETEYNPGQPPTVTFWDVYKQGWVTTHQPTDQQMATLSEDEREAIEEHLTPPIHPQAELSQVVTRQVCSIYGTVYYRVDERLIAEHHPQATGAEVEVLYEHYEERLDIALAERGEYQTR